MASDTNTLAPCPFCRGAALRSTGGHGSNAWFGTGCGADQSCPAHLRALVHRTQDEADATWNRRAPVAAPAGMEPAGIVTVTSHKTFLDLSISEWRDECPDGEYPVFTAAQVQAMGRVPPVWQAVPVEPTENMRATFEAQQGTSTFFTNTTTRIGDFGERYRAMIQAAPAMPSRQPLTDDQVYEAIKGIDSLDALAVWRAAEAAHGIKAIKESEK